MNFLSFTGNIFAIKNFHDTTSYVLQNFWNISEV